MSFKKAIRHGKTRRKPYSYYHVRNHDGRRFMWPSRNNLICQCKSCGHWTVRGRKAKTRRRMDAANASMDEYLDSLKIQSPVKQGINFERRRIQRAIERGVYSRLIGY